MHLDLVGVGGPNETDVLSLYSLLINVYTYTHTAEHTYMCIYVCVYIYTYVYTHVAIPIYCLCGSEKGRF